jgi:hypothetical protein
MGPTSSFAQPALVTPPVTVGGSHPLPTTFFRAQVPGEAMSTPLPPPVPTVSTSTPQASTSGITVTSPQSSKSPRGTAAAKPIPIHSKHSTKANLEAALPALAFASIPSSSTIVHSKGDVKRAREDEIYSTTLEVSFASSPKRVKSDLEGPPNEEAQKRDEKADNF